MIEKLMMRCVVALVFVGLCAPAALADSGDGLQLDAALLGDVGELLTDQGAFVPLAQEAAPPPRRTGGGAGGSLPPQLSGVGVGLQVGSPTALTIKFAGIQQNGFVLGIGAGFNYYDRFGPSLSVHGDYLLHLATLVHDSQLAVTFYAGVGLWVAIGGTGYGGFINSPSYFPGLNSFGVGVRVPVGLSLSVGAAPIEIYLELDPALFVFPGVNFGVGASLGFRWHF
jgi:hypothetical protein